MHTHTRFARHEWIVMRQEIIGAYPTEASAYKAAVDRAIEGEWKLRNREARREFAQAMEEGEPSRIVGAYNRGTDYSLLIEKKTLGATLPLKSGFDRRGNWSI